MTMVQNKNNSTTRSYALHASVDATVQRHSGGSPRLTGTLCCVSFIEFVIFAVIWGV